MTDCDRTCQGETCAECGQHVHPWDGAHWAYCWPGARKALTESLTRFLEAIQDARAVLSPTGTYHAVDCPQVKAHITMCEGAINNPDPACWSWSPWGVEHRDRAIGHTGRCCSPPITVQPPERPQHIRVRLTGIGWPEGDRCARGRLPQHSKRHARIGGPVVQPGRAT